MTIYHATVKGVGDILRAILDWNAGHTGTAEPDAHAVDGAKHTGTINDTQHGSRGASLHTDSHAKSHAITSATDHTSAATSGQMLKADANGLPVDATNTDAQVSAAVTASHAKQHAITATADHTSTATSGQMLKADANGLPVDATNTDAAVAAAVTASHARQHDVETAADHTNINALRDSVCRYKRIGNYHSGWPTTPNGTLNPTEDTLQAMPFYVPISMTFNSIMFVTNSAWTNAIGRMGVYTDNGDCYPAALLADSGDVSAASPSGLKAAAINVTLTPGLYWLVFNWDQAGDVLSGALNSVATAAILTVIGKDSTTQPYSHWRKASVYAAMPANFPAGATATSGQHTLVYMRRSA